MNNNIVINRSSLAKALYKFEVDFAKIIAPFKSAVPLADPKSGDILYGVLGHLIAKIEELRAAASLNPAPFKKEPKPREAYRIFLSRKLGSDKSPWMYQFGRIDGNHSVARQAGFNAAKLLQQVYQEQFIVHVQDENTLETVIYPGVEE